MDSTAPRRDVAELEAALEAALERQRELEGDLRRAAVRQHQGEHLLDAAPVAIVVSDEAGIIRYANHRTAELFGYEPAELVGQELEKLVPSRFAESHRRYRDLYFGNPRLRAMKNARELVARHRDGREFPVDISLSPLETATGMVVSAAISDITDRKRVEDALIHQALHDSLTGLPNRTLLMDRLEQALARRSRHSGRVAVLFVDIDRFKWVNDSLGHMAGDAVLAEVGNRLQSSAREGDTAARVGGDEFVVVCEDVESEADAVKLAERCAGAISVPIPVYGAVLRPTVSIGIALSTTGQDTDPDALLRDADAAMYQAKASGRARYEVFGERTRERVTQRLRTELHLRQALESNLIQVYFQPEIELATSRVVGMEALARWEDPERGVLLPDDFIPVAEATGLILPLGQLVLEGACREAANRLLALNGGNGSAPKKAGNGVRPATMAVNLSGSQLLAPGLAVTVREALDSTGLPPELLTFEITESMLLIDLAASAAALGTLKELGVRVAIDDFGTGYSSLRYLKGLPVDELKIDRSFVAGLGHDDQDLAIVSAILDMAAAFHLSTTAEGVERPEQLVALMELGCQRAQGFYWTEPLPAGDLEAWMTLGGYQRASLR